jgi:hypothetical protein
MNKHVDNLASLASKSTKYRFWYLKPLKIKLEPSTLMISTSSIPKMHLKLRSQSWATDKRLKSKLSTSSTSKMLKSLDIAILPSPLTLPLLLSPNVILWIHHHLTWLNWTFLNHRSCVVCTHYQTPNAFLWLCNWHTKEKSIFLGTQTCLGPWRLVTSSLVPK